MKEQRWPGDYETIKQEFRKSYRESEMSARGNNTDLGNDYLAMRDEEPLDRYMKHELEPSASMQLDTVGMQPHAREYLERDSTGLRSRRQFITIDGQSIDHTEGIQFSGYP
jgi:hypothetical protein